MAEETGSKELPPEEVLDPLDSFLGNLPTDGTPVLINSRSGLGEQILIGLKVSDASDVKSDYLRGKLMSKKEYLGGDIRELITVTLYAIGNGVMHNQDELGIIGHRDLVICHRPNGEIVIGSGFRTNDYLPPQSAGFTMDSDSLKRFSIAGSFSVERLGVENEKRAANLLASDPIRAERLAQNVREQGDPYAKGFGRLMQAVALDRAIRLEANKIMPDNLYDPGKKMWSEFGVNVKGGETSAIDINKSRGIIRKVVASQI